MQKKSLLLILSVLLSLIGFSRQAKNAGTLSGNILDEQGKALQGASIQLLLISDTSHSQLQISDKNGGFFFNQITFGYYRLYISYIGLQPLIIDSIHFREDRSDFNLTDLRLEIDQGEDLDNVIIYTEKPLIETKDGNITFNASESALAAGSTASELLASVPLVAKDPDGKITVRGREPRILIDGKPVELNMEQLQDLLESMPGSSIEKIEVLMNPSPEFANEQGGVINIITRKGKVGMSGRISVTAGTRGEANTNANFSYRKNQLALNVNAGVTTNKFTGEGYAIRSNQYKDSANFFNNTHTSINKSVRPNLRIKLDYDFDKKNFITTTFQLTQNSFDNLNVTEYQNINRFDELWRLSNRKINSTGEWLRMDWNTSYTRNISSLEKLRVTAAYGINNNNNDRLFYQEFLSPSNPKVVLNDSTQNQLTDSRIGNFSLRLNYDKSLKNKKTSFSLGSYIAGSANNVEAAAEYWSKLYNKWEPMDMLSNHFIFSQTIQNARVGIKQFVLDGFSVSGGSSVERTLVFFDLIKEGRREKNKYTVWLPYLIINKNWEDIIGFTLSYRKNIRRPGINQLNPTINFSDPYNVRFGNIQLLPTATHTFDLMLGSTQKNYYLNLSTGFNIVEDAFGQIRRLKEQGVTEITWENISGRKEWEISTWNGISMGEKLKVNMSANYTYAMYSKYDKETRKFRNGGSFTSNLSSSYIYSPVWNFNGSFNINRFANPQGAALWGGSMHVGVQHKMLNKKLVVTLSTTDPFVNQRRKSFTYGENFMLESFRLTRTRNFKISVAYNLVKLATPKNNIKAQGLTQIRELNKEL